MSRNSIDHLADMLARQEIGKAPFTLREGGYSIFRELMTAVTDYSINIPAGPAGAMKPAAIASAVDEKLRETPDGNSELALAVKLMALHLRLGSRENFKTCAEDFCEASSCAGSPITLAGLKQLMLGEFERFGGREVEYIEALTSGPTVDAAANYGEVPARHDVLADGRAALMRPDL